MNHICLAFFVSLVLMLASPGLTADTAVAPLVCPAPTRPDVAEGQAWDEFLADVDGFRDCIRAYQAIHYEQSQAHRQAADGAVRSWNAFVREHLNVPEDFPHSGSSGNPAVRERQP